MVRGQHVSVLGFVERFQSEPRLRRRAGALTGVSVFFAAGLVVAGFGQVVLVVVGLAVLGGVLAVIPWSVSRDEVGRVLRVARSAQAWERLSTRANGSAMRARRKSVYTVRRAWASASAAAARADASAVRETQVTARAIPPPTADELYGWPYAGSDEVSVPPSGPESRVEEHRRQVVELNSRGIDLRRAGSPAAAAALHFEALQILRSLHEEREQAPTLNSLALALAANGETDAAVERFEQALSILRERPDDPGQGEVIANLGFTLLRRGDHEHARELLSEALRKLPPESRAARKVEAQLRRAS